MTKKDLIAIKDILEGSEKSENPRDYGDEDGGWGPAMGFAANEAKKFNKNLKKLINTVSKEIESL